MNVLVTGGAGFIGSHTVVELIERGHTPIIIDDFRNSSPNVLRQIEKITNILPVSYNFDCTDKDKLNDVFKENDIDGVIHFAAYKAVGESVEKPLMYYENNIGSLVSLLEIMEVNQCSNIVFSSSCTVYGNPESTPVTEDTPIGEATSPYGFTKQVCERILQDVYNSSEKIRISILRYFNPIGAHPSGLIGELPMGTPNNLVPFITQSAIGERGKLTVFGNDYNTKDGSCIRDYIHVVDLAKVHIKALEKTTSLSEKSMNIYNVGTGEGLSVLDIINRFMSSTNTKVDYQIGPRRFGDVESVYADNRKITSELDWSPEYSVEDALVHAWKWQKYISNK